MFGLSQPQALGKGQTAFDWDIEAQKMCAKEEWLPGVEDQLWACEEAAEFLAPAAQFPQDTTEAKESDDTFISARVKPQSLAPTTIPTRSIWGAWEQTRCPSPHKWLGTASTCHVMTGPFSVLFTGWTPQAGPPAGLLLRNEGDE